MLLLLVLEIMEVMVVLEELVVLEGHIVKRGIYFFQNIHGPQKPWLARFMGSVAVVDMATF